MKKINNNVQSKLIIQRKEVFMTAIEKKKWVTKQQVTMCKERNIQFRDLLEIDYNEN